MITLHASVDVNEVTDVGACLGAEVEQLCIVALRETKTVDVGIDALGFAEALKFGFEGIARILQSIGIVSRFKAIGQEDNGNLGALLQISHDVGDVLEALNEVGLAHGFLIRNAIGVRLLRVCDSREDVRRVEDRVDFLERLLGLVFWEQRGCQLQHAFLHGVEVRARHRA